MLQNNINRRLEVETSVAIAVDFQEKLMPIINNADKLIVNVKALLAGAALFHVPVLATEQYPKGLGSTVDAIQSAFPEALVPIPKVTYSCCDEPRFIEQLTALNNRKQVILFGIETPICILQTAIDLIERGYSVYLPEDACSGQIQADCITALRRLELAECIVTCVESILYCWCRSAKHEQFKALSRLVRNRRQEILEIDKNVNREGLKTADNAQ